jgi:pimeloyl-ACP methyl ester carboxylesterase
VINLAYDDSGKGEPVLFIAGRGGLGRTWHLHQVPAFLAAGYRVITFDNRGVGATANADGFTTETMVADTVALIESLEAGPVRIVAVSMGSYIAQELLVVRPDLVSQAVLMATRGRLDCARDFFRTAEDEFAASGVQLPVSYDAKIRLLENFSPKTLSNDEVVAEWIGMFKLWPIKLTPGLVCQGKASPQGSRLPAYRSIPTPVLVLGFADDVVTPPHLGKEVADAMPKGTYLKIADTGHLGFLERPEVVNTAILDFFTEVPF